MNTVTREITVDALTVPVSYTDQGDGPTLVLLHGGGGPGTVAAFAQAYAETRGARVITPVHPGYNGTPRPAALDSMAGLAQLYLSLLADLGLSAVTVVGNSIGGWIAAEMAVADDPQHRRAAGFVLVDAAGLQLDDAPTAPFFDLDMSQVADLSYYEPDKFRIDVAALPPAAQQAMAANRATLQVYAGESMADPTLLGRLPHVGAPTLIVWGAADRMIPIEQGRAYAAAIPDARFEVIAHAGHLPQLETPEELADLVEVFLAGSPIKAVLD